MLIREALTSVPALLLHNQVVLITNSDSNLRIKPSLNLFSHRRRDSEGSCAGHKFSLFVPGALETWGEGEQDGCCQ